MEVGLIEMRRDGLHAHYRLRAEVVHAYVESLELRMRLTTTSPRRR
jgi:hypothetical protein